MIRAAIIALLVLPLAACGFAPVYGSRQELTNAGPISIAEIEGRTGHFLRQELLRTVGQGIPGVKGSAQLEVTLSLGIERLAFAPDQAAARSDYAGNATWVLRAPDGTVLESGTTSSRASFNFADSAYADLAAQSDAQQRLATLLASAIRAGLILDAGKPATQAALPPAPPPIISSGSNPVQVIK